MTTVGRGLGAAVTLAEVDGVGVVTAPEVGAVGCGPGVGVTSVEVDGAGVVPVRATGADVYQTSPPAAATITPASRGTNRLFARR
ncbi:hypothetical protein [Frankia sp. Cppng1_Ct_nod]|uniref:hypothetical protein n=1 Tax=Frankia sp. Cppng1_Ct_nod TaxID=2897162 RepID=UPI0010419B6D|nr:hypothetical protein [Frankia sp. Cppng1_Ct_nod]